MANLERTYVIPLRKQVMKSPNYKRAKKATTTVRNFLEKHMKSDDVKIGQMINREIWKRGIKSPPGKIKVIAIKDDKGVVKAELFGYTYLEKKREKKVEKSKLELLKEKIAGEKKEDVNKEAITDIPEQKEVVPGKPKADAGAEKEKERKAASGKAKSETKDKQ